MSTFAFNKNNLLPILSKHGFSDIDEAAFVKVMLCIEISIFNILNNVMYIMKNLKIKILKKEHFMAVLQIMKDFENGKEMKGGDPVQAAEYYGYDSGRYFDADVVSAVENQPWADTSLTRTALDATFGGASEFITKNHIKTIVEKFQKSENQSFKVGKGVSDVIISCVLTNLDKLFAECPKTKKKLTMPDLYKTLVKNSKRFAHMSYIFK